MQTHSSPWRAKTSFTGNLSVAAARTSAEREMETNEKGVFTDWRETHKLVAENDTFKEGYSAIDGVFGNGISLNDFSKLP